MRHTVTMTRFTRRSVILPAIGMGLPAFAQTPGPKALALISIDGMHPDYVLRADEYNLAIPNLRRILRDGAHAKTVRGVLPTVTYPSHTTLLTGVWPVKHGIYNNVMFDPSDSDPPWYWYAEDVRVPTLWQAARQAGYVTGSVSWPVSVGAPGVEFNVPEYWRSMRHNDLRLLRAIATPRLVAELEKYAGDYIMALDNAVPGDWARTRYASALIERKGVRFLTLHLASLDHLQHESGPFSGKAFDALEEIDKMAGAIEESFKKAGSPVAMCIVSDHGFVKTAHQLNLIAAFVKAGLMQPGSANWKAAPWLAGGSAAIVVKDPSDTATRDKLEHLLRTLAADAENGIAEVLDAKAITRLGGAPNASFWVNMRIDFSLGSALDGPLVRSTKVSGTHGYVPQFPALFASFFISGPGVRKALDLGAIDMRSVAPTLAKYLRVPLASADLPPLNLE